ncbi:MAG TPA: 3D domain-containing protein [Blastocatellia bacterium]|nr:3D domain-containing protein [Blastocatellia bacterium]
MNHFPRRRFTKGLTSGLSLVMFLALLYCLSGNVESVEAADNPAATSKPAQDNSIEIPGTFKNLPGAKDAVTSKRSVEELESAPTNQLTKAQIEIDEKKGVTINLNKSVAINATIEVDKGNFQDFHATAYCLKGRTASGAATQAGMIAADPKVLPLGTVVRIQAGRYTGTYTVTDTGGRIKGRLIDVYVPTYKEAVQFGRRPVKIKVVSRTSRKTAAARDSVVLADIK